MPFIGRGRRFRSGWHSADRGISTNPFTPWSTCLRFNGSFLTTANRRFPRISSPGTACEISNRICSTNPNPTRTIYKALDVSPIFWSAKSKRPIPANSEKRHPTTDPPTKAPITLADSFPRIGNGIFRSSEIRNTRDKFRRDASSAGILIFVYRKIEAALQSPGGFG